jgi:hypothetical protein
VVNVAVVDMGNPEIQVIGVRAAEKTRGRETTSAMAARTEDSVWETLVAVNGDFFELDGETLGNSVVGGRWVRAAPPVRPGPGQPDMLRTHFALTAAGAPLMGRVRFDGRMRGDGRAPFTITSINADGKGGSEVYNEYVGIFTPTDSGALPGLELPLEPAGSRADTTLFVAVGRGSRGGRTAIPPDGAVVRIREPGRDMTLLSGGDTVRAVFSTLPYYGNLSMMVGGMPRLVAGGTPTTGEQQDEEGSPPAFKTMRHPRTGIGFSRDSTVLYLVTVDGRQESSAGMTLAEFARLLIELGVSEGLNLDGGGSTTMVVQGKVVSTPSDAAGERPVANCVVVRARRL